MDIATLINRFIAGLVAYGLIDKRPLACFGSLSHLTAGE
jgi:hypothetical protein